MSERTVATRERAKIRKLEATVAELKKDRDIALDYISAVGQAQESLERIAEL